MMVAMVESSKVGEDADQVVQHRTRGKHGHAEITRQQPLEVDEVLHDRRLVEAEGVIGVVVGRLGRLVPDDGQHRIDAGQPTDEEGHRREPDEGHGEAREERAGKPGDRQREVAPAWLRDRGGTRRLHQAAARTVEAVQSGMLTCADDAVSPRLVSIAVMPCCWSLF